MASDGPQPPIEYTATSLSEVDLLRLKLAGEKVKRVQAEIVAVVQQQKDLHDDISRRYNLTPADVVDGDTGAIRRASPSG